MVSNIQFFMVALAYIYIIRAVIKLGIEIYSLIGKSITFEAFDVDYISNPF